MGTEQSYPIGAVLTRKDKKGDALDEVRVVGGGKQLIVTSNTEFGGSVQLDANQVRREYTSDLPDEVLLSQPTYVDPGPTPEQVFAEQSRGDDSPKPSAWRSKPEPRKSEDPRTEIESSKTDTGIPVLKDGELPGATKDKVEKAEQALKETKAKSAKVKAAAE